MALTAPALAATGVETTLFDLLHEWLSGYFDGAAHTVGGHEDVVFPAVTLAFQQAAIEQPQSRPSLQVVWHQPGMPRFWWDTVDGERQRMIETGIVLTFWIRSAAPATEGANARRECKQVAERLAFLLGHPAATQALGQKGLLHCRPNTPQLVADTHYSLRLLTCRAVLRYPVLISG